MQVMGKEEPPGAPQPLRRAPGAPALTALDRAGRPDGGAGTVRPGKPFTAAPPLPPT